MIRTSGGGWLGGQSADESRWDESTALRRNGHRLEGLMSRKAIFPWEPAGAGSVAPKRRPDPAITGPEIKRYVSLCQEAVKKLFGRRPHRAPDANGVLRQLYSSRRPRPLSASGLTIRGEPSLARVSRSPSARRHSAIFLWSPESRTSGTRCPRYSGGRV